MAGLSDRLVESKDLEACVATQLASFYLGREVRAEERATFARVGERFNKNNHQFSDMLIDFVTLPGFGYRMAE